MSITTQRGDDGETELMFGRRVSKRHPQVVAAGEIDELNAALRPHSLRFAPDISTASRATVGGMMANNSSGARSVLYGKTIDHVIEQRVGRRISQPPRT